MPATQAQRAPGRRPAAATVPASVSTHGAINHQHVERQGVVSIRDAARAAQAGRGRVERGCVQAACCGAPSRRARRQRCETRAAGVRGARHGRRALGRPAHSARACAPAVVWRRQLQEPSVVGRRQLLLLQAAQHAAARVQQAAGPARLDRLGQRLEAGLAVLAQLAPRGLAARGGSRGLGCVGRGGRGSRRGGREA